MAFTLTMVLLAVFAGLMVIHIQTYAKTPADSTIPDHNLSNFIIAPGEGFRRITRRLADSGIIKSPLKFRLLARFTHQDKRIKAGEYRLRPSQSPGEILTALVGGDVVLYRLTVPEGFTLEQISQAVAAAGLAKAEDFRMAAKDPQLIDALGIHAPSLEGYLFPDTYYFPRPADPKTIIRTMVNNLMTILTPKWRKAAKQAGFTIHQVLTLASIIEKETGAPAERRLISSVFYNRLQKKMRLASDPTVIYGIPDFDGNLTRKHLQTPGPYNTYLNTGLPPGPIANPGAQAIKAALFPKNTDYLFFVSKKDGTHQFSPTGR